MDSITAGASTKDRVVENLYMGGGFNSPEVLERFSVVCLCAPEVYPPDEDLCSVRCAFKCPLADSVPSVADIAAARNAAVTVSRSVKYGVRTLVTCLGGLNRSGLVVGLALRELGYNAEEAILLVRAARGPFALSNKHFVEVIEGWEA